MARYADDTRADLERQLADLKAQVARMSKSVGGRASEAFDRAEDTYEDLRRGVHSAAGHVRDTAQGAVHLARENPVTAATALSAAGLLGLALGVIAGSLFARDERSPRG